MRRTVGYSGLSSLEQQILDRWDNGAGSKRIAEETGASHDRVINIISTYCSDGRSGDFDAMVRAGTLALASAIAASGGRFA